MPLLIDGPRESPAIFVPGGLFLDLSVPSSLVPSSRASKPSSVPSPGSPASRCGGGALVAGGLCRRGAAFLSVSMSVKGPGEGSVGEADGGRHRLRRCNGCLEGSGMEGRKGMARREGAAAAMNATNHLWAGAVAAMVSGTFVAPLERLKLEYMVCGERNNLFEAIKKIYSTQGLKGFWKGNLVNILRTAPFKAVNFYAYDTYRKQLVKLSGNEEATNFERFVAGAAAGVTATVLGIPMDTVRTKIMAPGGEALGGVFGAFRHMIKTEGLFSLYKGLLPCVISMAPAGAIYYGVYDILKSAYLRSPEGMKSPSLMKKQEGEELSVLDQLELGATRTLLFGAVAGACAEAATYPFEVVRRQLQMQVQATKLSAFATFLKIVERDGFPALYVGLVPSLLQVLPSSAISYFVYEFMKVILRVE